MTLRDIRRSHEKRQRPQTRERIVADPVALRAEYAAMEREVSTLLKIVFQRRAQR